MIRINLLEKREGATPSGGGGGGPSFSVGVGPVAVGVIAIILLSVGWLGYAWWDKTSEIDRLEVEIADAQDTLKELEKALRKVDEFEAKKAALEQRVELISDLKRRQVVPVHLLDQVSRELPDFLWLSNMTETGGALRVTGKATTYNAVSNFYNNLKDSPNFQDVTLGTTRRVPEGVSFQLSCRFVAPTQASNSSPDEGEQNVGG